MATPLGLRRSNSAGAHSTTTTNNHGPSSSRARLPFGFLADGAETRKQHNHSSNHRSNDDENNHHKLRRSSSIVGNSNEQQQTNGMDDHRRKSPLRQQGSYSEHNRSNNRDTMQKPPGTKTSQASTLHHPRGPATSWDTENAVHNRAGLPGTTTPTTVSTVAAPTTNPTAVRSVLRTRTILDHTPPPAAAAAAVSRSNDTPAVRLAVPPSTPFSMLKAEMSLGHGSVRASSNTLASASVETTTPSHTAAASASTTAASWMDEDSLLCSPLLVSTTKRRGSGTKLQRTRLSSPPQRILATTAQESSPDQIVFCPPSTSVLGSLTEESPTERGTAKTMTTNAIAEPIHEEEDDDDDDALFQETTQATTPNTVVTTTAILANVDSLLNESEETLESPAVVAAPGMVQYAGTGRLLKQHSVVTRTQPRQHSVSSASMTARRRANTPMPTPKEAVAMNDSATRIPRTTTTEASKKAPTPQINRVRPSRSVQETVALAQAALDARACGAATPAEAPRTVRTKRRGTATAHPTPASSAQHWSRTNATHSVLHPSSDHSTPRETKERAGGVCMDLSEIFHSTARTPVPRAQQPPATVRSKVPPTHRQPRVPPTTRRRKSIGTEASHHPSEQDDWADKQVQAFTKWLNYTFYPTEANLAHDSSSSSSHSMDIPNAAPSALKTLVLHQRTAAARLQAFQLYQRPDMVHVRTRLRSEIARGRIALRPDRDLHANLHVRQTAVKLLLSYHTPWLRLALETVFGTAVRPDLPTEASPQRPSGQANKAWKPPASTLKHACRAFIVQHVLSDEGILHKYTKGKCKVPSGRFEEEYRQELRSAVLYRLLVLIFFLDRCKQPDDDHPHGKDKSSSTSPSSTHHRSGLLLDGSMLFVRDAPVKSTRDVLLFLCREFLKSEGDFVKHLSRVGLRVSYKQDAVDELDFTVSNLRVDLNDGVRLCRVTELLCQSPDSTHTSRKSLLSKLRLPAVSRLQKFHNVSVALEAMLEAGVDLRGVASHHVVDGHRDMVLKLLWAVCAHCCLDRLLSVDKVRSEIRRIQRLHAVFSSEVSQTTSDDTSLAVDSHEALSNVLVEWCNVICSQYGQRIHNLSDSFADGRAVCFLIHYYHPTLLRRDDIRSTTRSPSSATGVSLQARNFVAVEDDHDTLLWNEHCNASLANTCMSELGGIPQMIPHCDTANPPEAKSMLLALCFLCSRLMESGVEVRACVMIQMWYRSHFQKVQTAREMVAAEHIWRAWTEWRSNYFHNRQIRYGPAVQRIEAFVSKHQDRLQVLRRHRWMREHTHLAATLLQKHVRSWSAKRYAAHMANRLVSAMVLQSSWRQVLSRRAYEFQQCRQTSAVRIQRTWRHVQQSDFERYQAAIHLQRIFRGYWSRVLFIIDVLDVVAVQACARRWLAQRKVDRLWWGLVQLQCIVRRRLAQRERCKRQESTRQSTAALSLQMVVRGFQARTVVGHLRAQKVCVTKLQSTWRRHAAYAHRRHLAMQREEWKAALNIQTCWRQWQALQCLHRLRFVQWQKCCAVSIQCLWRRQLAQNHLYHLQQKQMRQLATIRIQSAYRSILAKSVLQKLEDIRYEKNCAVCIQCFWRKHQALHCLRSLEAARVRFSSSIRIQMCVRMFQSKTALRRLKTRDTRQTAAIAVQSLWRRSCVRKEMARHHANATMIQARARRWQRTKTYALQRRSLILLQSRWKSIVAVRNFQACKKDACLIQSTMRMFMAKRKHTVGQESASILHGAVRQWLARRRRRELHQQAFLREASATTIQRYRRGFATFQTFRRVQQDAIIVQKTFRRFHATVICRFRKDSVHCLQQAMRSCLARIRLLKLRKARRIRELTEISAANKIQAAFRGSVVRSELDLLGRCALCIQRVFRGGIARLDCYLETTDIIVVQSVVRRWLTERKTRLRRVALLKLQCWTRVCKSRSKVSYMHTAELSAMKIQKTWRCYTLHIEFMIYYLGAIAIQACVRRYLVRRELKNRLVAAIRVQSFTRLVNYKMFAKRQYEGAVSFQSLIRMYTAKSRFKALLYRNHSAILIQTKFRMFAARFDFLWEKRAARLIQRYTRGFVLRIQLEIMQFAASEIQRMWRGYVEREFFAWHVIAAICLQRLFRVVLAKQQADTNRMERYATNMLRSRSCLKIQKEYRAHLRRATVLDATLVLQQVARDFISRLSFGKVRRGVLAAQSLLRGRSVRQKRSKKLLARAIRVERANVKAKNDPGMKLGNRTKAALKVLQRSNSLSEIMEAVSILEIATRLSEKCCTSFALAGASAILLALIRTCNRSLPHTKLLHGVLLILSNVAKYKHLLPSIASATCAEVFLDLVQMFRDKDFVFCLVVSLLERIVRASDDVMVVCKSRENLKRLKAVRDLCVRKIAIAGSELPSQEPLKNSLNRPERLYGSKSTALSKQRDEIPDMRQGVRRLQRIVKFVESKQM